MSGRRILAVIASVLLAAGLAACAGMPTSGPVTVGLGSGDVDDSIDLLIRAAGPQKGATPQQIVDGFLAAGATPQENWAVAKQFLTPELKKTWNPKAGVTIDTLASRNIVVSSDESVTATVRAVGEVDATGAYADIDPGPASLPFTLAKDADGEWRISKADDGIVLDRDFFPQVFRPYSLMFFDPTWTYLVPDVRWFPPRNNAVSRIVTQLIDGEPSPWLSGAVATAFPDEVTAPDSVTVTADRIAEVEVPAAALTLSQTQLDRMQAQLEQTLASASISGVVMKVGTVDIAATPAPTRSTRIDAHPAVLTKDGFGFLSASELEPIAGISQGMQKLSPLSIELSPDQDVAAVRVDGGAVVRLRNDQQNIVVDSRAALIDPTVDRYGYIWSVPATRPGAVRALAPDGTAVDVADAWSGASRISAMQLSRDGTRMVALVTSGGRDEVWIAGVVRDTKNVPVRLGQPKRLAFLPEAGVDVAWLDDATVGVVTSADGDDVVLTQPVGGSGTTGGAPRDVTTIAGGNQLTAVRLLASDGTMYLKTGTRWQSNATGVLVLATQQGSPP